jgi:hypothetical protein
LTSKFVALILMALHVEYLNFTGWLVASRYFQRDGSSDYQYPTEWV